MNSYIKNRNRLINILDNCAKIIRARKDYDDSQDNLSFKISSLTAKLREEEHCTDTVSMLYSKAEELLELQKQLGVKQLSQENLLRLRDIVDMGEKEYEKEIRTRDAALNTMEYLQLQKEHMQKEIEILEQDIETYRKEGKAVGNDFRRKLTRLTSLKSGLDILNQKIEKKDSLADETEELKKKFGPVVENFDELLKELTSERSRLNRMFYLYFILICVVVAFLIGWETFLIGQLYSEFPPENWIKCIIIYLPIPISAGLLWAFIYQLNRSQRQLASFAERIHIIKYKNSLLQTSMELYSDGLKNEDHVARLIDDIMKSTNDSMTKPLLGEKVEEKAEALPFDKIVELVKALTGK